MTPVAEFGCEVSTENAGLVAPATPTVSAALEEPVTFIGPDTSNRVAGAEVPTPTFPFASTVRPDPAAAFDWKRVRIPLVEVPALMTLNRPAAEFKPAFDEDTANAEPVVKPLAPMDNGVCVVAVDQFQFCAKFRLSMVFTAAAAVMPFNGSDDADPPSTFCQDPF